MAKEIILTSEGLEKLKADLKKLKEVDRASVIGRIKAAKEFGDLSENAEYEDAKNEQAFIEGKILELEEMIKHAKVVSKTAKNGEVGIGSLVECLIEGGKETFEIVGTSESDPASGKISSESPVGKALFGHKAGEKIKITAPGGVVEYKIVSVK